MDVQLPYKDGKVATALCVGGPICFEAKPDSGVDGPMGDEWLIDRLMPKVRHMSGSAVAKILVSALLYAVLDEEYEGVPICVREHVLSSYPHISMLWVKYNRSSIFW